MSRVRSLGPAVMLFALVVADARACGADESRVFGCPAAHGRKFIELCEASPMDADGWLRYRFGALDRDGQESKAELEYPAQREGSLQRFHAAVYTGPKGFTKSVRFTSGNYDHTVFTRDYRGTVSGGVEVRDRSSDKLSTVQCDEDNRFYIYDLKDLVACDEETPVGKVCLE